ncbi:MAG: hypothetical protein ABEJ56_02470 [Candidatus Nanohaloarchaea archaeon]
MNYHYFRKAKNEAVQKIEGEHEDLDQFELEYRQDLEVPSIGMDVEDFMGAMPMGDDMNTGQAFQ